MIYRSKNQIIQYQLRSADRDAPPTEVGTQYQRSPAQLVRFRKSGTHLFEVFKVGISELQNIPAQHDRIGVKHIGGGTGGVSQMFGILHDQIACQRISGKITLHKCFKIDRLSGNITICRRKR